MIFLYIFHIIISILLIAAVLLQMPEGGLGSIFGGGGEIYHTKRGAEKTLYIATIILGIFFSITATLNFFLG